MLTADLLPMLVPTGETRFATNFMCCQRLLEVRDALTATVLHSSWDAWAGIVAGLKREATEVKQTICCPDFWDAIKVRTCCWRKLRTTLSDLLLLQV